MAGGRGDDDLVTGDLGDPPGGRPQCEDVPHTRFVDHLLVQFPDTASPRGAVTVGGEEHPEKPTVRDCPPAGHGDTAGPGAGGELPGDRIVDQHRPEVGEVCGGVASADQVDDPVEGLSRQGGVRVGPPYRPEPLLDVHTLLPR